MEPVGKVEFARPVEDQVVANVYDKADIKAEEQRRASDYLVRERRTGLFSRSLRLSENVDTENIKPRYERGVLMITLPMLESKKAKHFKVA